MPRCLIPSEKPPAKEKTAPTHLGQGVSMSKIPQGEWNAIAARYQGGESISKIARSYGCTPPAIHYILKRNRQKPTELPEQPRAIKPAETKQTRLIRINAPDPVF